ncbi:MAG: hypothetical protein QG600_21 [Patescibacteria group bacterium]|jgi:cell division protein FtsB|nr:hypothetical protein [Patescibacteria group bacterium]
MKKVIYAIIIIFSIYISNNLIQSIYNLLQKQDLVTMASAELVKEKNEYEKLKDQLEKVKRVDFIEEEARNKLFMVQPGEQLVLVPQEVLQASQKVEDQENPDLPYWQQWLNLFK